MCYQFSSKSVENMKGVLPDLILIFTEAIKNSPVDFGIPSTGGLRTAEQQAQLFKEGKSKADGVHNKSKHQKKNDGYCHALDFYAYVNGYASWQTVHLCIVAGVILSTASRLKKEGKVSISLYWGGQFGSSTFNGWDMPHTEAV